MFTRPRVRSSLVPLALLAVFLAAVAVARAEPGVPEVLVNHIGFTPQAAKFCLLRGTEEAQFEILDTGGKSVSSGMLKPAGGDFPGYLVGEFTSFDRPGTYRVRCGGRLSEPFRIAPDIYQDALNLAVKYFSIQRCGPSKTGYNAPCHLDDGRRTDNGQHQDVTGGWHDAGDLRRWVTATIYGMIGLSKVAETLPSTFKADAILDELRWGNRYFLAMQEPTGYVMNYCGGDVERHGDDNRWTDNISGNADDRRIVVRPVEPTAQFCFVMAQAAVVRLSRTSDPDYARRCEQAARKCLAWCVEEKVARTATDLGAGAAACVEMYRTFREPRFAELAAEFARQLADLQVTQYPDKETTIRGFYRTSKKDQQPLRDIYRGPWPLLGLCSLAEEFPEHVDARQWRTGIEMYCQEYLAAMAVRNAFGIVPYSLYTKDAPGGRRVGSYGYRWFMECDPTYWVGINSNVASAGVGLVRAARLLRQPAWAALAQRQLDWILGVNPFNASTMEGAGRNQPKPFITSEFKPVTPTIPGAVMNGIGGTVDDVPQLLPGHWQTCEYWTPMTCYTMWLMAELQRDGPNYRTSRAREQGESASRAQLLWNGNQYDEQSHAPGGHSGRASQHR